MGLWSFRFIPNTANRAKRENRSICMRLWLENFHEGYCPRSNGFRSRVCPANCLVRAPPARDHGIYIAPPRAEEWLHAGFLEEVMLHEGAHVSLDTDHIQAPQWIAAQQADGGFLNTNARDHTLSEDIAETAWAYFVTHYRPDRIGARNVETILATIPNRLAYFDAQRFDMSPYVRVAAPQPVPTLPLAWRLALAGLLILAGATGLAPVSVIPAKGTPSRRSIFLE